MTTRTGPFTVWAIPKEDDGRSSADELGTPRFTGSWNEADDYIDRNSSPDNYERYVMRDVNDALCSDYVNYEIVEEPS